MSTSSSTLEKPAQCGVAGQPCDCPIHDQVALLLGITSTTGRTVEELKNPHWLGKIDRDRTWDRLKKHTLDAVKLEAEIEAKKVADEAAVMAESVRNKLLIAQAEEKVKANQLMISLYEAGMIDRRQVVEDSVAQVTDTQHLIKSLQNRAKHYDHNPGKPRELKPGGVVPTPIPKGYGERWNDVCRDCHGTYDEHVEIVTLGEYESEWACTRPSIGTERETK